MANEPNPNMFHTSNWNPLEFTDQTPPSAATIRVLNKELADSLKTDSSSTDGIHFVQDDNAVTTFHALVVGPKDTPYEGGFFYFFIRVPPNYPFRPPLVKLMTTGNATVRFNPNLYNNGKVCLSILGTWPGPSWTALYRLRSVLISIQSLMCKEPFFNEPGFEGSKKHEKQSSAYSENIRFQTIRVAVLDMVENANGDTKNMPQVLKDKVKQLFQENVDFYAAVILNNLDCKTHNYLQLQERLNKLLSLPAYMKLATYKGVQEVYPVPVRMDLEPSANEAQSTGSILLCPICNGVFQTMEDLTHHASECGLNDAMEVVEFD